MSRSSRRRPRGETTSGPAPAPPIADEPSVRVSLPTLSSPAVVAIALAFFYFAIMSGHLMSMDGLYMERQAYSLLFERSVRYVSPLWTWRTEPTLNSLYGIGLSLLYLPGFLIAAPLARRVPLSLTPPPNRFGFYLRELYEDPFYAVGGAWLHPVITALTAYFVAQLVLALGFGRRAAMWSMVLFGIGSSAMVYSRGDFAQPLEGLCWVVALLYAVRYRASRRTSELALCAAATSYAILTRPVEGLLLIPAVAVMALPERPFESWKQSLRPVIAIGIAGLVGVAGTLFVNFERYGNAFEFGYPEGNTWELPGLMRWLAVLVSPGRGLLPEFPAVLLVPLGVFAMLRGGLRRELLVLAGLCLALLVNVAAWAAWWGGWCWGLRLFLPAGPLLAVLAGIGASALGREKRWIAYALLVAGFAWAVPCVVTDILGGYGGWTEGVPAGWHWQLTAYPPIGAWRFLTHVFAKTASDPHAVDIVWFRYAPAVGHQLLLVPGVLIAASLLLVRMVRNRIAQELEPEQERELDMDQIL